MWGVGCICIKYNVCGCCLWHGVCDTDRQTDRQTDYLQVGSVHVAIAEPQTDDGDESRKYPARADERDPDTEVHRSTVGHLGTEWE